MAPVEDEQNRLEAISTILCCSLNVHFCHLYYQTKNIEAFREKFEQVITSMKEEDFVRVIDIEPTEEKING